MPRDEMTECMGQPRDQKTPQICGLAYLSGFSGRNETAFFKPDQSAALHGAMVCVADQPAFCYVPPMNRQTPKNDDNDPIELWGTRIGRGLGFLITIGIILGLIVWLGAARP